MSYIKDWSDGALTALKYVVSARLKANPKDKRERKEMRKIEQELRLRRTNLNKTRALTE